MVVGRHFPINSVISNIIYINICTLVAARTQYQWNFRTFEHGASVRSGDTTNRQLRDGSIDDAIFNIIAVQA